MLPWLVVSDLVLFRELVEIDAGSNARFAVDAVGARIAMIANGFLGLLLFIVHFTFPCVFKLLPELAHSGGCW